ncbi:MAG: hypothetical protein ABI679_00475 [Gemmatimonadota bacterium]
MRFSAMGLIVGATCIAAHSLHAQRPERQASLGIHFGADVTDQHTLKLVGGQLAFNFPYGLRAQAAVTSVIEEPGTFLLMAATLQWHLSRGVVRPFIGGGVSLTYQDVGAFGHTDTRVLGEGGLEVPLRNLTPFAQVRLINMNGTTTQILGGFKMEFGRYPS